jgi:hypothetical protein
MAGKCVLEGSALNGRQLFYTYPGCQRSALGYQQRAGARCHVPGASVRSQWGDRCLLLTPDT